MISYLQNPFPKHSAFSLLELVIVIVLIGIMAISFSSLTKNAIFGYIDAKDRNRLSQSAKWVTEKISREMREALPQSVRAGSSNDIHCVEFMSIINGSTYLDLPASGAVTNFTAVDYNLAGAESNADWVAIMPINSDAVYNTGSGTLGDLTNIVAAGADQVTVNIGSTTFANRSPHDRFYLLGSPTAFCVNDDSNNAGYGQVIKYTGQDIVLNQEFPPATGAGLTSSLMGENFIANGAVFNYADSSLTRSGLLQINLIAQNRDRNLSGNDESFEIFHEVHIRNVP